MPETDRLALQHVVAPPAINEEDTFDDGLDAHYDPYGHEAWHITQSILEERLGKHVGFRSDNYLAAPYGSRYPGFQQEYPVELYKSHSGESAILNLVLKGNIIDHGCPVWMNTHLGLALRQGKEARLVSFEQLAVVQEPFQGWQPDLFDIKGNFIQGGKALRVIRLLRQAKKNLYLPQWVNTWMDRQDDSDSEDFSDVE